MQNLVFLFLSVFGIWLIILSVAWYRVFALFKKLTKGVGVDDLKKVLEKLIDINKENKEKIEELRKRIDYLEDDGRSHVQKVGLVRFNPFKELGGDHSFSLAILDANDSGIVITSLHTRDRTRVYMKDIKRGKSGTDPSEEERKALESAIKRK